MLAGVSDDAGVYKLTDDLAIVETVDMIAAIVDDPYDFGAIAATNGISDIYAMGGRPITAMNIVAFPSDTMDTEILGKILRGALDKLTEAGVALVGGHSVRNDEVRFGLSVTGIVPPIKSLQERRQSRRQTGADQGAGHRHTQHGAQGRHAAGVGAGTADRPDEGA